MTATTTHPFRSDISDEIANKQSYTFLEYPSGKLLSVSLDDNEVLMDKEQAVELLRILTVAVPLMGKD